MKIDLQKNVVQFFTVVAFLIVNLSLGQVTLPHYDGINYTIGNALQTRPGWAVVNSGDDIVIGSGSLSNSNLPTSNDNKITFDGQGIDAAKAFTSQAVGFGTVYFSFLLNVTNITGLSTTNGGYFAGITDTSNGFASTVWLRSDGVGGYQIGLAPRTSNTTTVWGTSRALSTNYLVIISLTSVAGLANDVSKLWVDPILNGSEPTPSVSIANAGIDLTSINRILIRQGASASETPFVEMDELRIGLSFESVSSNVWDGSVWTNGAPTATTNALINGIYSTTTNGTFTAKNLIVEGAGALTVNSNTGITVNDNINNKLTADKFIVQNNANVAQSGTTNGNLGNITVNRNSTPMIRLDYTYWSSPVAGQNLLGFSPLTSVSPTLRFYDYDENANAFTNVGLPTNFAAGKGYSVRAPNTYNNTPTTFAGSFVGIPNNGTITVPVTNSGVSKGYNFVGNPYASPINANLFRTANGNVSTLYYWAHTLQGAAASANYATFNGTGSVAAAGGATPNNFIQTGQGFIVKATAGPSVTFTNAMRSADYTNQFFRTSASNASTSETDRNRIWLNLSNNDGVLNQTMIGYVPGATNGLDNQFDANLFENNGIKLYNVINDEAFAIQGKSLPFLNTDSVALGFKTDIAGSYTIAIDQVDGLFLGNQNVFLKDNLTGIIHNLKLSDYTFASNAGVFNARFSLVYQTVLASENPVLNPDSLIVYNQNNVLNINAGASTIKNVKIFDLLGRMILEKKNISATTTSIANLTIGNAVLLVQVTTSDNKVITKKVLF